MDVFGPSTPHQKGKRIGELFEEVLGIVQSSDRANTLLFVPEKWRDLAVAFAAEFAPFPPVAVVPENDFGSHSEVGTEIENPGPPEDSPEN